MIKSVVHCLHTSFKNLENESMINKTYKKVKNSKNTNLKKIYKMKIK